VDPSGSTRPAATKASRSSRSRRTWRPSLVNRMRRSAIRRRMMRGLGLLME